MLFQENGLSMASWYRRASYGKTTIHGAVFGPYTLDRFYRCDQTSALRTAAIQAADRDIDFTAYRRVIVLFPPNGNCDWGGISTLACVDLQSADGPFRSSWIWMVDSPESPRFVDAFIHEMGHSLGLGHARFLRFPGEALGADEDLAVPLEYGDSTSSMGSGAFGDFAAPHKLALQWIDGGEHVAAVENDGEFLLSPLEAGEGLRALRVRRHPDRDEWLWVEFRQNRLFADATPLGFRGALVRSQTRESGGLTNLIDLTPASLEASRLDFGEASEVSPELPQGARWRDPHSAVELAVGDPTPEGRLPVTVSFANRCASVMARNEWTISFAQQELVIPVSPESEGCAWEASANRHWLRVVKRDATTLSVMVAESPDGLNRRGTVTIGRHPVTVIQTGRPGPLELVSFLPDGQQLPVDSAIPFLAKLRDINGPDDTQVIHFSVNPSEGSSVAPCFFRYATVRRVMGVSSDGRTFLEAATPDVGRIGACALRAEFFRPRSVELVLRLWFGFFGATGEKLTLSIRAEDKTGAVGEWLRAGEVLTTNNQCRVLPATNFLSYIAGGGLDVRVGLIAAPDSCAWTAASDSFWIRPRQAAGAGAGVLSFDVDVNNSAQGRDGRIFVNDVPLLVTQYGKGEIQPELVTLRPSETVVSSLAGAGGLVYFYSLADTLPAMTDVPWLQAAGVRESEFQRTLTYLWEANPNPEPRTGTLTVGGKRFTVVQLGSEPGAPQ